MKLLVLKLISLIVLLGGIVFLGLQLGCPYIHGGVADAQSTLASLQEQGLSLDQLLKGAAVLLVFLGLYGFLPRLPRRRRSGVISFPGEFGEVIIALDTVEETLNKFVNKMPEVRKMRIKVRANKEKTHALVQAQGKLVKQPEMVGRDAMRLVHRYIEETARTLLGVEELGDIKLRIDGVNVDPKRAGEALRQELIARMRDEADMAAITSATLAKQMSTEEQAPVQVPLLENTPKEKKSASVLESGAPLITPLADEEMPVVDVQEQEAPLDDPDPATGSDVEAASVLGLSSENSFVDPIAEEAKEEEDLDALPPLQMHDAKSALEEQDLAEDGLPPLSSLVEEDLPEAEEAGEEDKG